MQAISRTTRLSTLVTHLDQLIAKYEQTHPEVAKDLRAHREVLQEYTRRANPFEVAKIALRIAVWVKFIKDHWPDG